MSTTLRALTALLIQLLPTRAKSDRGSHAVEYAIGIGLGAAIILALYAAYRAGVGEVISGWVFA